VLFLYAELLLMATLMAACGFGCALWVVAFGPYTVANVDSEVAQIEPQPAFNGTNSSMAACPTDIPGMGESEAVGGSLYIDVLRYYYPNIQGMNYAVMCVISGVATLVSRGSGHGQWRRAIAGSE
jgi:hypothetical protein